MTQEEQELSVAEELGERLRFLALGLADDARWIELASREKTWRRLIVLAKQWVEAEEVSSGKLLLRHPIERLVQMGRSSLSGVMRRGRRPGPRLSMIIGEAIKELVPQVREDFAPRLEAQCQVLQQELRQLVRQGSNNTSGRVRIGPGATQSIHRFVTTAELICLDGHWVSPVRLLVDGPRTGGCYYSSGGRVTAAIEILHELAAQLTAPKTTPKGASSEQPNADSGRVPGATTLLADGPARLSPVASIDASPVHDTLPVMKSPIGWAVLSVLDEAKQSLTQLRIVDKLAALPECHDKRTGKPAVKLALDELRGHCYIVGGTPSVRTSRITSDGTIVLSRYRDKSTEER